VQFIRDDDHPDLVVLPKVRAIDPLTLQDGHPILLSELDPAFANRKATHLTSKQGKWGMRIETHP
jgi:hypothetical protein